jgi:hypothetical protein
VFSHCLPTSVVKSSKGQPSTSKEIEIDVDRSLKLAADGGGGGGRRAQAAPPIRLLAFDGLRVYDVQGRPPDSLRWASN